MLDPLEADRDVKISEVKRLVHSSNFKLRPDIMPVGCGDRVGGYVDPSHTDGACRQQKVRPISVPAAEVDDRATGHEVPGEEVTPEVVPIAAGRDRRRLDPLADSLCDIVLPTLFVFDRI